MKQIIYIQGKFDPKTLPKDPSKAVSGTFYHGIIPRGEYGWYAGLNILESGMLQTPNYIAYWDPNFALRHHSARYKEIKDLRYHGLNSGGLTPTTIDFINVASGIRQGLHIQKGSKVYTDEQKNKIIERNNIEINFEIGRRKYAKSAVSRLDCIYVADNKSIIEELFNYNPDLLIFKVKIAEALNYTRVDSKWFDKYSKTRDKKCIKNYWTGQKYDENTSSWEYLVDGLIQIDDPEHLAYLNPFKKEWEDEFNFSISTSKDKAFFVAYN